MNTNEKPVKWILIGDEIRASRCLFHRDLLNNREYTCDGGGIVTLDDENKTIIFSGESTDFGKANEKQFNNAISKCFDNLRKELYFVFRKDVDNYNIIFK